VWQVGNYFYVENRNELARDLSELLSALCDEDGHMMGLHGDHMAHVLLATRARRRTREP